MAFGEQLKELRKQRGLSQAELAHRASLDAAYVSRVERGLYNPPKISTIQRLGQALGLTPQEQAELITLSGRLGSSEDLAAVTSLVSNAAPSLVAGVRSTSRPEPPVHASSHGARFSISEGGHGERQDRDETIEELPSDPYELYLWAKVHRQVGQPDEALRYLRAAVLVPGEDYTDFHNCAALAQALDDLPLARQLYDRALQLQGDSRETQIGLADCLSEMGEVDEAEALFKTILEEEQDSELRAQAINHYLDHLMGRGPVRADEARHWLGELRPLGKDSLENCLLYFINLAVYRQDLGLSDEFFANELEELTDWLNTLDATSEQTPLERMIKAKLYADIASHLADQGKVELAATNYIAALKLDLDDVNALMSLTADLRRHWNAKELALKVRRLLLKDVPHNQWLWKYVLRSLLNQEQLPHVPATVLLQLKQLPPGEERLRVLDAAIGPVTESLEELRLQAQGTLGGPVQEEATPKVTPIEVGLARKKSRGVEAEQLKKGSAGL